MPHPVVLDVDTGTDDAGALAMAATSSAFSLVAALAGWGNCGRDQAVANTLAVLEAAGSDAPVYPGARDGRGRSPAPGPADMVMGADGLGGQSVEPAGTAECEPAAEALVRLAQE